VPSDVLQIISTSDFKRKTRDRKPKRGEGFSRSLSSGLSAKLLAKKDNSRAGEMDRGTGDRTPSRHSPCSIRLWLSFLGGPLMAFLCKLLSAFFVAFQTKERRTQRWTGMPRQTGTLWNVSPAALAEILSQKSTKVKVGIITDI